MTSTLLALVALGVVAGTGAAQDAVIACRAKSGSAALRCLAKWTATIERCRKRDDAPCEAEARAAGGTLEAIVSAIESKAEKRCDDDVAFELGYVDEADVTRRLEDVCRDWGEDALAAVDGEAAADPKCQAAVTAQLRRLRFGTIKVEGKRCILRAARGKPCDRSQRDAALAGLRERARKRIDRKCGAGFDALEIGSLDDVIAQAATNARHFAIAAYPPRDMGPTSLPGPFPVGIRTVTFSDPSRSNVQGTGPRQLVTEIYYPSTEAAVAGVPNEIVQVLGVGVTAVPAHRDVAAAAGTFPLLVFSHGSGGLRIQSTWFQLHMASHGYVVAAADHEGDTFVDLAAGNEDPETSTNRPLDVQALIDAMLAASGDGGDPLFGRIDADRIGVWGHSAGGFTSFMMAGTGGLPGVEPDGRVKAIMPLAPAAPPFGEAFFRSIAIPTLIVGGSIDETHPFEVDQRGPYDAMSAGGAFVGLARIVDGGLFTFSDFCEVDRTLLAAAFPAGFAQACQPRHLPWRHARDRVNYLALNFFDGHLRGDAAARSRLDPVVVNAFDDLDIETK